MVMDNKHLVRTVLAFTGIIAGILFVNRWVDRQIKDIAVDLPAPVRQTDEKAQRTGPRPRTVIIDQDNDPLAPVIARKQSKSSPQKAAPRPTSPQRIYEPAEENIILVQ